jgi:pimeloyl-ACP methyl ester carboxylesterase
MNFETSALIAQQSQPAIVDEPKVTDSITDEQGLRMAYNSDTNLYFHKPSQALYIAGTKDMRDVSEWPLLPMHLVHRTTRYKEAVEHLARQDRKPARIIGHSLGSAVGQRIASDLNVEFRGYGTPAFDLRGRGTFTATGWRARRNWDPVGILDRSANRSRGPTWWGHSYKGFNIRSNETVS